MEISNSITCFPQNSKDIFYFSSLKNKSGKITPNIRACRKKFLRDFSDPPPLKNTNFKISEYPKLYAESKLAKRIYSPITAKRKILSLFKNQKIMQHITKKNNSQSPKLYNAKSYAQKEINKFFERPKCTCRENKLVKEGSFEKLLIDTRAKSRQALREHESMFSDKKIKPRKRSSFLFNKSLSQNSPAKH